MGYGYLVLVVIGFASTIGGFFLLGRDTRRHSPAGGLAFLGGVIVLTLGILLTCVPDFFTG